MCAGVSLEPIIRYPLKLTEHIVTPADVFLSTPVVNVYPTIDCRTASDRLVGPAGQRSLASLGCNLPL